MKETMRFDLGQKQIDIVVANVSSVTLVIANQYWNFKDRIPDRYRVYVDELLVGDFPVSEKEEAEQLRDKIVEAIEPDVGPYDV